MNELKDIRNALIECANVVDEVIKIDERESKGEKVSNEEKESIQGKMVMKFIKMQQLSQSL